VSPRGRIALAVGLGVVLAGLLSRWEPLGMNLLFQGRAAVHGIRPVDSRIRLLVVDQQSFAKLGKPFVLWQAELAKVLDALAKAEAAVVGIDLVLHSPEGYSQGEQALVDSMQRLPVILSEMTQLPDGGLPMLGADPTVRQSSPALTRVAKEVADAGLTADEGVVRALPPPTSFIARVAEALGAAPAEGSINYPGAGGSLPEDNLSDVLTRLEGGNPLFEFKGVACLIVADGWTYRNLVQTPFGPMSTGDVQAAALNTMLMRNPVRPAPLPLTVLITVGMSLAGVWLGWRWLVPLALLYAGGALELFTFTNWALPLVAPSAGLVAGRLVRVFSPRPRLRGTRQRVTLLHSHLGGFAAGGPEKTIALLEDYVEDMDLIASRHQGVLTRLAGDELLATFPSADAALRAGLEMLRHVEGMEEFARMGMGLHTGDVVTGDVSGQRTVLGDELTRALQVGSESRACGIRLLVSAVTRQEVTLPEVRWQSYGSLFAVVLTESAGAQSASVAPVMEPSRAAAAQAKSPDPVPSPTSAGEPSGGSEPVSGPSAVMGPAAEETVPAQPERTIFGSVRTHIPGFAADSQPEVEHEANNLTEGSEAPPDGPPEVEHEANNLTEGSPTIDYPDLSDLLAWRSTRMLAPAPRVRAGLPHRMHSQDGYCFTLGGTALLTHKVQEPAAAWLERSERSSDSESKM